MTDKDAFDLIATNAVAGKYPNWTNEKRCELMQVQLPASGYRTDLEKLHADLLAEIARLSRLVGTVRAAFNRECDDADAILRVLGLDPVNCRTDGGSLKLVMLLGAIEHRDVTRRREAAQALRGEREVLARLLLEADKVVSTIEGACQEEWDQLAELRRAIAAATLPHRPEEADLLAVRDTHCPTCNKMRGRGCWEPECKWPCGPNARLSGRQQP